MTKPKKPAADAKPSTPSEAFITFTVSECSDVLPEVVDGLIDGLTVSEYVNQLPDGKLLDQVLTIGKGFRKFKKFFLTYADHITALRARLPISGPRCKIHLLYDDGASKLLSWTQFCLEVFEVSARHVSRTIADFKCMNLNPDIDIPLTTYEDEPSTPPKPKKKVHRPTVQEVENEYEEKVDRVETQAATLRLELGNLIHKIEQAKAGKLSLDELYTAAQNAKTRVVPPKVADAFNTDDPVGTGELMDAIDNVLKKNAAAAGSDE